MAKKHKSAKSHAKPSAPSFNPEDWPYFTPLVFAVLFLALVVLFSDFIFSDKMLHMSDQIQAGVFFRTFLVEYVQQHGAVPQWNPYIFGGMPYVEAFHGDIFYPLSVLKFIAGTYRWQGWTLFFHIFLAGLFMYFAARQFKLSKIASLLAVACYTFAPYLVSLVSPGHDGKIYVTALFPLVMFFLERGLTSETFKRAFFNFSLLGLVIGVIILSPHPQMSYYMLWAAGLFTVFRLVVLFRASKSWAKLIQPASLAAYAVVIGLLLSAIQFYPGYLYTQNFSPRADTKQGWEWATSWSLHEEEAFSLLIPEFSGTNAGQSQSRPYWGKNFFKDNSESVVTIALFLAAIGFFFSRRREAYFFGGLALFALVYALGATTPIFKIFFHVVPMVKSLRSASIIMFIFSFSAALLAGMGAQAIIDEARKARGKFSRRFEYLLFGFPGTLLLLAILFKINGRTMLDLWSSMFYSEAPRISAQGVTKLDLAYMNLPSIQSGAWMAFLFVGLAALFVWLYRNGKAGMWALTLLILLPIIDGVRFNQRFVNTIDLNAVWSRVKPVTDIFTSQEGKFRVMNLASHIIAEDVLPFYGTEVVVGYHGNQLRWYDHLLGGPAKRNERNPRFLNLVGAKYIMFPGDQQVPEGYFGDEPVAVTHDFRVIKIWRNENALPRAFLVDSARVFNSVEEAREQVLTGSDDFLQVVYLEQQPEQQYAVDTTGNDSVWIIDYQVDSVLLGVNCDGNKILVLTDNYYDAWHAYVDGVERPVLRSYGSFRAVEIPAGTERVLFKYKSMRYRTGKLVTALTSLYLLVIIGTYAFTTRRNKIKRKRA
ncbi:MAG: hypothetical protein JSU74_05390 [Candidatus Zixiibacteriota bacterium]|nr:MAG: hypothetical protein JSU74_05390 [candidate division Zixibacteria bacterium]